MDAAFPESPSPQGRAEWVAEQIFEWAGYGGTHLRVAAFFMENLLALYGRPQQDLQLLGQPVLPIAATPTRNASVSPPRAQN